MGTVDIVKSNRSGYDNMLYETKPEEGNGVPSDEFLCSRIKPVIIDGIVSYDGE